MASDHKGLEGSWHQVRVESGECQEDERFQPFMMRVQIGVLDTNLILAPLISYIVKIYSKSSMQFVDLILLVRQTGPTPK